MIQPSSFPRALLPLLCALLAALFAPLASASSGSKVTVQRVFVIPHSHWEGQVFKTREEYLQVGLPNILKAMDLLEKYPEYRFVLDQMCYVKPFLERYPAEEAAFRRYLGQGRLQIVGGTNTMNDSNIPSGEAIVRQYLMGKRWFRQRLGYEVSTGWAIDTFGHNAQMPQILRLAGMQSYWFQRGAPNRGTPSEFLWQGIDGTQIPAFWLPLGYGLFYPGVTPTTAIEFDNRLLDVFDQLTPFSRGHERVMIAGADVFPPEELIPVMLERFNQSAGAPFRTQFATPADFEAIVAKRTDRPVVTGELNPVFRGGYSTRAEIKQTMREMERLLTTAERLGVMGSITGGTVGMELIEQAWEPVLFNQAHDPAIGVMSDHVYDDVVESYRRAGQRVGEVIEHASASIVERIDTSGEGVPIVVFNTLGFPRSDIAEVEVAFTERGVRQLGLFDATGHAVPVQIQEVSRNRDGGIRRARIAFIAQDVPALGHTLYRAVAGAPGARDVPVELRTSMHEDESSIENRFYRASFNLWTGAMTDLIVKEGGWQVLASAGNVVAREDDAGDWFELNMKLNPARLTAMQMPVLPPRPAYTRWSHDTGGGGGGTLTNYGGRTVAGPVFSEFTAAHPIGRSGFSTRVRLYHDLPRIDIRTSIRNEEDHVRYRAVFPTTITDGVAMHEIAFGAIERRQAQEFPAQNWIDYSNGKRGLTIMNRALPGNNVAEGIMMLSLGRSTGTDFGRNDVGRQWAFDYALLPHAGDWREALPWREGLQFNHPLIARAATPHAGEIAARWGLLEVSHDNVVVSALKHASDGDTVLRVYEAAGTASRGVRVSFNHSLEQVRAANLIEDPGEPIDTTADRFVFDLKPFQIRTFRLRFASRPEVELARRSEVASSH